MYRIAKSNLHEDPTFVLCYAVLSCYAVVLCYRAVLCCALLSCYAVPCCRAVRCCAFELSQTGESPRGLGSWKDMNYFPSYAATAPYPFLCRTGCLILASAWPVRTNSRHSRQKLVPKTGGVRLSLSIVNVVAVPSSRYINAATACNAIARSNCVPV